ncbi:DUF4982 domain-containing protein [Candidatus Bathyarchaeota archaeon]|nr:DUF4982 domain-containing protein [Candidatus Bathyarchaeota archaeon]
MTRTRGPRITLLDDGWFFFKGNPKNALKVTPGNVEPEHDGWNPVVIPHDWDSEGPFLESHESGKSGGYAPCGTGWYCRELHVPNLGIRGQKTFIRFDGIYMRATLWIDGKTVGKHLYGYGPFELDITDHVQPGVTHVLHVKVNNSIQPSCRWYTGSGIYRDAWLVVKHPVHVPWNGVFMVPKVEPATPVEGKHLTGSDYGLQKSLESTNLDVHVEIEHGSSMVNDVSIRISIIDPRGDKVVSIIQEGIKLDPVVESSRFTLKLHVPSPLRWSIDEPNLYMGEVEILDDGGQVADRDIETFGFRCFSFSGKGFTLNGEPVILKGVCLHHDGGCVGAAVPPAVWERRFRKLKKMGCNAIRTSHAVPAANFLDLCDRMGFLVIDEAFDKWWIPVRKGSWSGLGYIRFWRQELANFIKRDRNHPCVILWSLGNEIHNLHKSRVKKGHVRMARLVRELDPTRPITTVASPNYTRRELARVRRRHPPYLMDIVDVFCTNYTEALMPAFHEEWPDKAIIIAEAHHYYRNKLASENHLTESELHPGCTTRNPWFDIAMHDYACGQFLWVGIEYLGEVRDPYPYHGRTNAPIRISGFLKPQAGFHSSVWLEEPFVHLSIRDENADIPRGKPQFDFPKIACHWNFEHRVGDNLEAWVFTNCESVELILNGRTLGEKRREHHPWNDMKWNLQFEPGTLVAIGKNAGAGTCTSSLVTAGEPARLELQCDTATLQANGRACANVEISLVDKNGTLVQLHDVEITLSVSGAGRLVGIDNGDLSDFTTKCAYKASSCSTYWGQALAIIQSTKETGEILLTAYARGIDPGNISIAVLD